jgi:hypothetical protein
LGRNQGKKVFKLYGKSFLLPFFLNPAFNL